MFALDRHTAGLADFVASEEDHAPCCFCVSFKHIGAHPRAFRLILSGNTKTCDEYDGQCETFHEPPCFWVSAERSLYVTALSQMSEGDWGTTRPRPWTTRLRPRF